MPGDLPELGMVRQDDHLRGSIGQSAVRPHFHDLAVGDAVMDIDCFHSVE